MNKANRLREYIDKLEQRLKENLNQSIREFLEREVRKTKLKIEELSK